MREAEAKTLACPMMLDGPAPHHCKGSKCMAWRWYRTQRLTSANVSGDRPEHWVDLPPDERDGECRMVERE